MSYTPVVPRGGYAGWAFLTRTRAAQKQAFVASASLQREAAYFRAKIGGISTAAELVADRRLLAVALGAFGLEADTGNRFFVRKVLEDGTLKPGALANRLADKRYLEFSRAFGFGDSAASRTRSPGFAEAILAGYETRAFEAAVGTQNDRMRLAMNAERELARLAGRPLSETAKWFTVLGAPPLREVFETAFGLPRTVAALDLDRQLAIFRDKAERVLGSADLGQFGDSGKIEALIRVFLLRAETGAAAGAQPAPSTALALLGSADRPGALLSRRV